ncbi:hypothetical protein GCK72_002839 [Caenorhabditis remanei]|uniref:Sdz-33 F-box domain-containing protein n=1 Tax=Caenorhabditis remanei TaxID=31234 RepID=A0A6A5HTV9_CAERE|nr:hypothetical protein GCK72_002839 [Caenorhabditis remanei]KAF1771015.1 hypothetical protein GCK72_002839 [Caenorhabditis remanei]
MSVPFPLLRLPFLPFEKVIKQMNSFEILMLSLCSKASKRYCKFVKPAKPIVFNLCINGGVHITVQWENPKPEKEIEKNNKDWKVLYADDLLISTNFTISHQFNVLTSESYGSIHYKPNSDRTSSTYRISQHYFTEEVLKWIDAIREVFNASFHDFFLGTSHDERVIKWIEAEKPSVNKLGPMYFRSRSEFDKKSHVTNSIHLNDLLKLKCPVINAECTDFTDNDLNLFLKNWKKIDSNLKFLSVNRSPNSPEIDEKAVIEGLNVTKLEKFAWVRRGDESIGIRGYSISNDEGKMAVFGIDTWSRKNVNFKFSLFSELETQY